MRGSLKVPPRVPHKVETSLLHPGGKDRCADTGYYFAPCISQIF